MSDSKNKNLENVFERMFEQDDRVAQYEYESNKVNYALDRIEQKLHSLESQVYSIGTLSRASVEDRKLDELNNKLESISEQVVFLYEEAKDKKQRAEELRFYFKLVLFLVCTFLTFLALAPYE